MLLGVVNKGHILNIENVVIPGSVSLETNWMQLLYEGATDPIQEHYLQKINKHNLW